MEKKLSCLVGFTADLNELSDNIKEKAGSVTKSVPECPVAAAGFMVHVCLIQFGSICGIACLISSI